MGGSAVSVLFMRGWAVIRLPYERFSSTRLVGFFVMIGSSSTVHPYERFEKTHPYERFQKYYTSI